MSGPKQSGIVLIFLLFSGFLPAQSNLDSLWQQWNDASLQDTLRLGALQRLSFYYVSNAPDSARLLAQIQLAFAQEKALPSWEARALNTIGLSYRFQSDYGKAMQHYTQSLALLEKTGARNIMAAVYGNMGDIYRLQSNFPKAVDCIQQSLQLAEESGDREKAADAYVSIATIYYEEPGENEQIVAYLEKARTLYEALGKNEKLSLIYGNLSSVYLYREDNDKALLYLEKSLAIQEKMGDKYGIATSLYNRAMIFSNLGRYQMALSDFDQAVALFRRLGDQEGLADAYNGIGDIHIQQKNYPAAIKICNSALQIARAIGSPNLRELDACMCLYKAYQHQGKFEQALFYLEQHMAVKDSLQQSETSEKLKRMELDRQAATDSLAQVQERFQVAMEHQRALRQKDNIMGWLVAVGLGILAVALAFWVQMLYFQRRSNKLQAHSEALEKQQLLHEIALLRTQVNPHFLFNSLSILSSLVRVDPNLSEQFIEQLSHSYRYILEQKEQSLVTLRTELEFIRAYFFLLKIRFENKIDLQINLPDAALDHYKIAPLTLQLLVENAVKHNRMSVKTPLTITVTLDDAETLVVENQLQPRSTPVVSTGVGLQNIKGRYALLTERLVWAGETDAGMFVVRIPLLT